MPPHRSLIFCPFRGGHRYPAMGRGPYPFYDGCCSRASRERRAVALPFLWQAPRLEREYDYVLTNLGLCCQSLGLMKSARFYFEQDPVRNSPIPWVEENYAKSYEARK